MSKKKSKQPASAENSVRNSERRGNVANIEPYKFKPGQSGNPGGRPKKKPITAALEAKIEAHAEEIADCLIGLATGRLRFKTGSATVAAAKLVSQHVEGAIVQRIEGTGKNGAITVDMTVEEKRARVAELINGARTRAAQRG